MLGICFVFDGSDVDHSAKHAPATSWFDSICDVYTNELHLNVKDEDAIISVGMRSSVKLR